MKRTIKDGTSGYCSKPEDYHSNTPYLEIARNPPEQEKPIVCVGTVGHHSRVPRVTINWTPPGGNKQEKILYYTGEEARELMFPEVMRLHHIQRNTLPIPYLGFENGGLLVAGKVIWILLDQRWGGYHRQAACWVLPTKEYLKCVLEKAKEDPPQVKPWDLSLDEVKGTRDEVHAIEFTSLNNNFGIKARVEPLLHSLGAKEILRSCLVNIPTTKWDDPVNYAQAVEDGFVGTYNEWQWSEIEK